MVSMSPDRNTFRKNCYLDRCKENETEPDAAYLHMFNAEVEQSKHKFDDPQTRKNNLEYVLLTTDWILDKVRTNDYYAQNLYAALCNMQWQSKELWPTLTDNAWGCSWRYAGGIIADMQQKGDYIDWYCSGISGGDEPDTYLEAYDLKRKSYVPEGTVTEEIRVDLDKLGWVPKPYTD